MPELPGRRRPPWLDLLLAAAFVAWFYAPFLRPGLPRGDFPSTVAIAEVESRLVDSPLALPTWNPWLMCGRPAIAFASPFRLLALPLRGLDPIDRLKVLLVLYHVLGALAMYALVRACGAGADAALFAAVIYPVMPEHVARTATHGHVQLPMFWALLPLVFLAFFRLGSRPTPRAIALLALAIAACLMRDPQRAVLVLVLVLLLLAALAPLDRRARVRLAAFTLALAAAVAIDSFELGNGWLASRSRAGHDPELQARQISYYALDDVLGLLDRDGRLEGSLAPAGEAPAPAPGRYLGLSLAALIAGAALDPDGLGPARRRFWFVLGLLTLSVWLSLGPRPLLPAAAAGWARVLASPAVPAAAKLALPLAVAALFALLVWTAERNLVSLRGRPLLAAIAVAALLVPLLLVAPLPWLVRALFFLRDLRNPEWFSIAVASFAVPFAAALALGALARRFGSRRWWLAGVALVIALVLLDLRPYRRQLNTLRGPAYVAALASGSRAIAADPEDFRVAPVEGNSPIADLGYIWHGKRLAWDFRDYTAPRGTARLLHRVFDRLPADPAEAATLAGIANVKYVIDVLDAPPDIAPSPALELVLRNSAVAVYRNREFRPYVDGAGAVWSRPAPEQIDVRVDSAVPARIRIAESIDPGWRAWLDGSPAAIEPADGAFLGVRVPAGAHQLVLRFRPRSSHWAFAAVSLVSLVATLLVACGAVRRRGASRDTPPDAPADRAGPRRSRGRLGFGPPHTCIERPQLSRARRRGRI